MANKNLENMSEEELVELNNELSEKRAAAADEVKTKQLEVNAEISKRQLRRRLEGLSKEERAELASMIEEDADKRVNLLRTEQALETNPEVIAVSCPFCMTMLSDGIKAKDLEERVETLDVMEIVERVAK